MGQIEDDEGPEFSGAPPHPDDRLWRHPAEVAAAAAAQAAQARQLADLQADRLADTVELPHVANTSATAVEHRQRRYRTWYVLAAVFFAGASALAVGSLRSDRPDVSVAQSIVDLAASATTNTETSETDVEIAETTDIALGATDPSQSELAFASRILDDNRRSLTRVQAATDTGMVEGGGLFVTVDGHVATSARLVNDADYVLVWTHDGQRWPAEVVGVDLFSDIALLSTASSMTEPAAIEPARSVRRGQYAIAVNHGSNGLVVGQVASTTDAASADITGDASSRLAIEAQVERIEPGAAIFDDTGRVVALANAGDDSRQQATPGWMLERVTTQLLDHGAVTHPWLGVQASALVEGGGVAIVAVEPGSPAAEAGLRQGDVIAEVGQQPLTATTSLWTIVQQQEPGDTVALSIDRNGDRQLIEATLGLLPG